MAQVVITKPAFLAWLQVRCFATAGMSSNRCVCFFFGGDNLSSVENPGWLFDIRDYTTQLYGDYFISQHKDPFINQPGSPTECRSRVFNHHCVFNVPGQRFHLSAERSRYRDSKSSSSMSKSSSSAPFFFFGPPLKKKIIQGFFWVEVLGGFKKTSLK